MTGPHIFLMCIYFFTEDALRVPSFGLVEEVFRLAARVGLDAEWGGFGAEAFLVELEDLDVECVWFGLFFDPSFERVFCFCSRFLHLAVGAFACVRFPVDDHFAVDQILVSGLFLGRGTALFVVGLGHHTGAGGGALVGVGVCHGEALLCSRHLPS